MLFLRNKNTVFIPRLLNKNRQKSDCGVSSHPQQKEKKDENSERNVTGNP